MIKPPIPHDETRRLQSLYSLKILDTRPEERFDRITRLVRRVFNVPIALVSLVDKDRQWFKSRDGLAAEETSRDVSFCGHAINDDAVFVVSNAQEDIRFCDNPLVVSEPKIRFYAGYPLSDGSGARLGTLCIIDREAREFSNDERELLAEFGKMVETELVSLTLATIDELTRISNRRGFRDIAENALAICRRERRPATLVLFDLDDFKRINDTFGHSEGDQALMTFANCLLKTFRDSDVVARLGGDEFSVLFTGGTETHLNDMLDRFQENLETRSAELGAKSKIAFSAGVVAYDPSEHAGVEDLLGDADRSLYDQKRNKKLG